MSNQCFMPSDIARLTYGYLLETNCQRTAQCFLDESPYLQEFAQGIKNGFRYSTKPYNMSLTETLNGKFSQNINQMQSTVSATTTTFPDNFPSLHYQTTNVKNTNLPLESHNNNNINREHLSTPKHKILQSRNLNAYSPRRKNATPKRLSLMTNPHQQQQQLYQSDSSSTMNCLTSDSNVQQMLSLANTNSSPISSLACESSEIDIEVQPRIIFDELLKYRPLHDKVANTIQKIIDVKDQPMLDDNITNIINQQQQQEQQNIKNSQHCLTTDHAIDSNKVGDIEKDLLPPDTMDELLSSLAEEPEFQNFVHIVVEKEIANTPFKCQSSTFNTPSNTSNSSSLNTPNVFMTPINTNHNNQQSNVDKIHQKNSSMVPVKNLINELKTPERLSLASNRLNVTNNNKSNLITTTTTSNNLVATGSICSSSSTKIKPILQNHKFSRVNNKQREVQESIKNTTLNNNKIATATTNKPTALTTTIELVSDDHGGNHDAPVKSSFINNNDNGNGPNEQKSTTTTTSTSNSQMVCPQINNNNVEIVSIQNWSSTPTPTTNVLTRPVLLQDNNNQTITAWSDQQGLVYLTYPTTTIAAAATTATQETIYYLDSSNLQLSSTSTTINDSSLNATKITTAANDSIITDNDKSSVQEINSVSQQSNRSTVGSPRTVPSILSRGKRQPKIAIQDSKINQDCSNQPSAISSDYHHQSPSINRRKSDIKNSSGHHNSTQHNNQQQKKRKISGHFNGDSSNHHHHQTAINKRSPVMDTKVEKILGSNIEEFLVNYHGK